MLLIHILNKVSYLSSIAVTKLEIEDSLTKAEIQELQRQDRRALAKRRHQILTRSYQAWQE